MKNINFMNVVIKKVFFQNILTQKKKLDNIVSTVRSFWRKKNETEKDKDVWKELKIQQ